jgi:hypothetical protein
VHEPLAFSAAAARARAPPRPGRAPRGRPGAHLCQRIVEPWKERASRIASECPNRAPIDTNGKLSSVADCQSMTICPRPSLDSEITPTEMLVLDEEHRDQLCHTLDAAETITYYDSAE